MMSPNTHVTNKVPVPHAFEVGAFTIEDFGRGRLMSGAVGLAVVLLRNVLRDLRLLVPKGSCPRTYRFVEKQLELVYAAPTQCMRNLQSGFLPSVRAFVMHTHRRPVRALEIWFIMNIVIGIPDGGLSAARNDVRLTSPQLDALSPHARRNNCVVIEERDGRDTYRPGR